MAIQKAPGQNISISGNVSYKGPAATFRARARLLTSGQGWGVESPLIVFPDGGGLQPFSIYGSFPTNTLTGAVVDVELDLEAVSGPFNPGEVVARGKHLGAYQATGGQTLPVTAPGYRARFSQVVPQLNLFPQANLQLWYTLRNDGDVVLKAATVILQVWQVQGNQVTATWSVVDRPSPWLQPGEAMQVARSLGIPLEGVGFVKQDPAVSTFYRVQALTDGNILLDEKTFPL